MGDHSPTDLYRFFDSAGQLLYVGISLSAAARASQHRAEKPWWGDVARMDVEHYDNRTDAARAELTAIKTERPLHNVVGNPAARRRPNHAWLCSKCGEPIPLGEGKGYLQVEWTVMWRAVHTGCDDSSTWSSGGSHYWIDIGRVATLTDIEKWSDHLVRKAWFLPYEWTDEIWRNCVIPGALDRARDICAALYPKYHGTNRGTGGFERIDLVPIYHELMASST